MNEIFVAVNETDYIEAQRERGDRTVPVVLILACRTRGFICKADI